MKYSLKIILSILIFFSLFGCKKNVDLIVYNANVYTVNNDFTIVNAIANANTNANAYFDANVNANANAGIDIYYMFGILLVYTRYRLCTG